MLNFEDCCFQPKDCLNICLALGNQSSLLFHRFNIYKILVISMN